MSRARIVEELTSDYGADLLHELDAQDAEAILGEMVPKHAGRVRHLIAYPAASSIAGKLPEFVRTCYDPLGHCVHGRLQLA